MRNFAGFRKKIIALGMVFVMILTACNGSNSSNNNGETTNSLDNKENSESNEEQDETSKSKKTKETTKSPEEYYAYEIVENTQWSKEELNDPNFNLKGVESVRNVGLITGDGSISKTRTRFRVGGTDLGIPVVHKDKLMLWFGDTFWGDRMGNPMAGGLWRSNVLGISTDKDLSDGLYFDDFIGKEMGRKKFASERIESVKTPGVEHTAIPTGSVSVNGNIYVWFMSVKKWGDPLNPGGLAVSRDDGETFDRIEDFAFDPAKFAMAAALLVDDYVYLIGTDAQRVNPGYLARVHKDNIEDLNSYEYFKGLENGKDTWSKKVEDAVVVVDGQVGEPSVMWNEYLQEYMMCYLDLERYAIVIRSAKELWGPYSKKITVATGAEFEALYGGFVHEYMTEDNGKTFYFTMSQWQGVNPLYNSLLMEVKLK